MKFTFTQHALQQIFKREISISQVKKAVLEGEIIAIYPNDQPFPSKLSLHYIDDFPIHVVFSVNEIENEYVIITSYIPSKKLWKKDFKTRKL